MVDYEADRALPTPARTLPFVASLVSFDSEGEFLDATEASGVSSMSAQGDPGGPPVVPEPVSSVLFLVGVATLGVRGYLKHK